MQVVAPMDVSELQKQLHYWRERAIKAEHELQIQRDLRRAPVLKPIDKAIIEELRHTETYGTVKDHQGNTRANFTTIANRLHISPDTVKRSSERVSKLGLVNIHEQAGPQDEHERKYISINTEKLEKVSQLKDVENIVPKQGGNRYTCQHCHSERVAIRTIRYIKCLDCEHETLLDDTGYKEQKQLASDESTDTEDTINVQEMQDTQKQLAFQESPDDLLALPDEANTIFFDDEKQVAEHIVYTPLSTQVAEPPQFLQEKKIWVCWRYEQVEGKDKPTKVPYIAQISRAEVKAKSNDASTWRNYDDAKKLYERSASEGWKRPYSGIGIMCDSSFTVLDYDHCVVDGAISEQVLYRIQAIDSYAELSPSATGVHQIALGTIPNAVKKSDIEMYCTGRFLTWTHNQIVGLRATIHERQEQLSELHTEVAQPAPMPLRQPARATAPQCGYRRRSDDEIIADAKAAKNGAKFADLWAGTWSSYSSQSEADMALCSLLAYWTNYNEVAMERLFKQSGLYREDKWSRSVGRGETYGQRTISRACGERLSA